MLKTYDREDLEKVFSNSGSADSALYRQGARALMKAMRDSDCISVPIPRVHGNGFIQVDLKPDGSKRMHIWGHPAIPGQDVNTGVHDHTYGVDSIVIIGSLIDLTWEISAVPSSRSRDFNIYEAVPRDRQDTVLEPTGQKVSLTVTDARLVGAGSARGSRYTVEAGKFHSTVTHGPAVSIMRKLPGVAGSPPRPRIAVPVGRSPDNEFNRNSFETMMLYGIISSVYPFCFEQMDGSD